jgi:hypothetical protein
VARLSGSMAETAPLRNSRKKREGRRMALVGECHGEDISEVNE